MNRHEIIIYPFSNKLLIYKRPTVPYIFNSKWNSNGLGIDYLLEMDQERTICRLNWRSHKPWVADKQLIKALCVYWWIRMLSSYHNSNIEAFCNRRNNYFESFTIQSRYLSLIMSATMSLGNIVARTVFDNAVLALLPGLLQKYTYTLYTSCFVSAGNSTLESSLASTPLPL